MLKTITIVCLLCVLCLPGAAQVASAELSGTVLDSTGAAVGGAKVIAVNNGTNIAHETVSDGIGNYIIHLLPPGDYTVSAEAPGFPGASADLSNYKLVKN